MRAWLTSESIQVKYAYKVVRSCLLMSFVCLRIPHMPVCVLACSGHYCSTPLQIIYRALRGKLGHRPQNRIRRACK